MSSFAPFQCAAKAPRLRTASQSAHGRPREEKHDHVSAGRVFLRARRGFVFRRGEEQQDEEKSGPLVAEAFKKPEKEKIETDVMRFKYVKQFEMCIHEAMLDPVGGCVLGRDHVRIEHGGYGTAV